MLQFKIDGNQTHQKLAIESTLNILKGQAKGLIYEDNILILEDEKGATSSSDFIKNWNNSTYFDYDLLNTNINEVQSRNKLPLNEKVWIDEGDGLQVEGYSEFKAISAPYFTIEMETGTGKTYTYLRTIFELHQKLGFSKHVIVVPSTAIFEGVKKNWTILKQHLRGLYDNVNADLFAYDGNKISELRGFATNPQQDISILLITLAAFNKKGNKIYKYSESLPGELLPIQYINSLRPIVFLDEPQNMTSKISKESIRMLRPLMTFSYSATHREVHNLIYRLSPIDAFQQDLVKKIEVIGMEEEGEFDQEIVLLETKKSGKTIKALIKANIIDNGVFKSESIEIKNRDDLAAKTNNPNYQGYIVENIFLEAEGIQEASVAFDNGITITKNSTVDANLKQRFRIQIRETIRQHFEKQSTLFNKGIKVLSLFFIDRVDNYLGNDSLIRGIFEEEFNSVKSEYNHFKHLEASVVHKGYFAVQRNKKGEKYFDDLSSADAKKAADDAFKLIMRDKERLLSFEEPTSFIFAHSTLKEGWDNPNVFQICTLRETKSETERRQTIGRGLRIAVNNKGERVKEDSVNILTVITSETYADYVKRLQSEYTANGDIAPPAPKPPTKPSRLQESTFNNVDFRNFWRNLNQKVKYKININTEQLIKQSIEELNKISISIPKVKITKGGYIEKECVIELLRIDNSSEIISLGISVKDTQGNKNSEIINLKINESIYAKLKNKALKVSPFRNLTLININRVNGEVMLSNSTILSSVNTLYNYNFIEFDNEITSVYENSTRSSTIDIVGSLANETGLTTKTIQRIICSLKEDHIEYFEKYPETFLNTVLPKLKNIVAHHIADNILFETDILGNSQKYELSDIFPSELKLVQCEAKEISSIYRHKTLYDNVQIDSNVERRFVDMMLEDENVVLFFKFPSKFKIDLPRIIGNYNPDWGIIRLNENKFKLELVRETKGSENIDELRYEHEPLKIKCATKFFDNIGVNYRTVSDKTKEWWK